jgi:tRNA (cmo5U34)-methyltransferase
VTLQETTAAQYFGSLVESYDSLIRRAVPRYDEMLERLIEYLPRRAGSVLELGCGTGNLSLVLARRYPQARFTFIDAAPEMLLTTSARLEAKHPRVARDATFLETRFEQLDGVSDQFDLVVSSISLHHVKDKGTLYRAVRERLQPAGTFRFSDQIRGATQELHDINWERWLEFCRQPGNCTEDEIQSLLDHAEAHDHYTALPEQFRLLTDAGFRELDCVWRNWIWGIVIADV